MAIKQKMIIDDDDARASCYTEGNTIIAFNQSNMPALIEVYDVNDEYVTFASNVSYMKLTNKVYYAPSGRAYFKHHGTRYYLDECMTMGL